jgi:2-polyprenyl-3-methyl-5-hydroxy-6-metoxy-1,4-benzoquinol methylase
MQHKQIYKCLQNDKVASFVKRQYITSYSRYFVGHEDECKRMLEHSFEALKKSQEGGLNSEKWNKAIYMISKDIFKIHDDSFWFSKMHYAYKTLIRPKKDYESVSSLLKGKIIHDFGCDGGFFSLELLRNGYNVVLSDVVDHRIPEVKHLAFHHMKNPTDVGFLSDTVDTTIVKTVLHHIDKKYLLKVLTKLKKTGSRIIVEEDIYGAPSFMKDASDKLISQKNFKEFASMSLEEQYQYCTLTDYFSNAVIYGRPDITFPFNFKTVDEWKSIFKSAGFNLKDCVINGFNDWKLTQNCQAWFVLD